jgi:hypothetical protein
MVARKMANPRKESKPAELDQRGVPRVALIIAFCAFLGEIDQCHRGFYYHSSWDFFQEFSNSANFGSAASCNDKHQHLSLL